MGIVVVAKDRLKEAERAAARAPLDRGAAMERDRLRGVLKEVQSLNAKEICGRDWNAVFWPTA